MAELSSLTVLEAAELARLLKSKWQLSQPIVSVADGKKEQSTTPT